MKNKHRERLPSREITPAEKISEGRAAGFSLLAERRIQKYPRWIRRSRDDLHLHWIKRRYVHRLAWSMSEIFLASRCWN